MKIHTQSMHTYIENNPLPPTPQHTHPHPKTVEEVKMQTLCDYYIELRIYPGNCLQTVSQMYSLILRFNKQLFIET